MSDDAVSRPKGNQMNDTVQNSRGEWVPAIPEPLYLRPSSRKSAARKGKVKCDCGRIFKGYEAYRGHYALAHILALS